MAAQPFRDRRLHYREETRRGILEEAGRLLLESGLEGLSMRRLARRCGLTAPTLYHYFRDKHTLVDALLEERLQRLVADLRRVPLGADAVENVRRLCAAFASFGLRNPDHYQLLVSKRDRDAPELPAGEEARRLLGEPIEELARQGRLPPQDLELLRQGLWSLLHGFILLQTTRPDEEWLPGLLDRSLEALIRGALASGAGATP